MREDKKKRKQDALLFAPEAHLSPSMADTSICAHLHPERQRIIGTEVDKLQYTSRCAVAIRHSRFTAVLRWPLSVSLCLTTLLFQTTNVNYYC